MTVHNVVLCVLGMILLYYNLLYIHNNKLNKLINKNNKLKLKIQ